MNIVFDIGNSRIKTAVFDHRSLIETTSFRSTFELSSWLSGKTFQHGIISSVSRDERDITSLVSVSGKMIRLTSTMPLPIRISYKTPETLGVDRLAAACGAFDMFPGENCLVIDMGTCITYDLLTANGSFEGGAIAPGVRMRFAAMHQFTSRLPMTEAVASPPLTGKSTIESLQSGVINGVIGEINGFLSRYQSQFTTLKAVACGGDAGLFENSLKPSIFVAPNLVLTGLNAILLHHVSI